MDVRSRLEAAIKLAFSTLAWQEATFSRSIKNVSLRQVKVGDKWEYPVSPPTPSTETVKAMVSAQPQELRFEQPNKTIGSDGKLEREPTVYIYSMTEIKSDYVITIGENAYEQTALVEEWPEGNPIYWKASCKPL
jgi:hypothetical protein